MFRGIESSDNCGHQIPRALSIEVRLMCLSETKPKPSMLKIFTVTFSCMFCDPPILEYSGNIALD